MAENEAYRIDIVIDVTGDEQTKGKLKAMDKFMESARRRAQMLNKVRISPAAKLNDKISGPARRIQSVLTSMAKRTWTVTIKAKDMVTGAAKKIFSAITSPLGLIGVGLGGAAAFTGLVKEPLALAGNMEQARIGFETMLGSAEKATAFLRDLQAFAAKTPFEFPQLQESSQLLLAFGFGAEQILPMMTAIGNAMAGLGKGPEGIERAVTAIGQMRAKGKVSAEEIMQLTELGIPAYDIIQKKFRLTADQMDNIGKAGLNVNKVISAIIEGMNQRFPNMMDRQSRSLLGLWSTIKDTFNMSILYRWGDGLSKAVKPRLERLVDMFTKNEDVVNRWGDTLERVARDAGNEILDRLEKAFNMIETRYINNPEFQRLDFSGKVNFVMSDIGKAFGQWFQATGVPAVAKYGALLGKELMKATLTGATSAIMESPLLSMLLGAYIGAKTPGPLPVKIVVGISISAAPSILRILEWLTTRGKQITEAKINAAYEEQNRAFKTLSSHREIIEQEELHRRMSGMGGLSLEEKALYKGTSISKRALGGIFQRPHLGLVAEEGPESIIPLSARLRPRALALWQETGRRLGVRQYATGGIIAPALATVGGNNINVTIPGINIKLYKNDFDLNEEALALKIGWQIVKQIKNHLENEA